VAELAAPPESFFSIPWGHLALLLERLKAPALRLWYAQQAAEHGWSRNILALQMNKAIGVSEYQLTRHLPRKLKGSLPTITEIEKELGTRKP
jgi:predicted nuclease of restriction endonuclease-like (RecB) superfamily